MTSREQADRETARAEARRRARLEAVFGDVLPETTSDERDSDVRREDSGTDAWLREQVPPHHG